MPPAGLGAPGWGVCLSRLRTPISDFSVTRITGANSQRWVRGRIKKGMTHFLPQVPEFSWFAFLFCFEESLNRQQTAQTSSGSAASVYLCGRIGYPPCYTFLLQVFKNLFPLWQKNPCSCSVFIKYIIWWKKMEKMKEKGAPQWHRPEKNTLWISLQAFFSEPMVFLHKNYIVLNVIPLLL